MVWFSDSESEPTELLEPLAIGDTVERLGVSPVWRARITGFAPNGMARVHRTDGQRRIWPLDNLNLIHSQAAAARAQREAEKDAMLETDLRAWVDRLGIELAKEICRLVWPANPAYEQTGKTNG